MRTRFFEDFKVGDRIESRGKTLTEADIVAFGFQYDPQPFHIDAEAAKRSLYGGLIASGFQTLAVGFRMLWDTGVLAGSSLGSPGFDELRWLQPVRPGDTLRTRLEVLETRPSGSKPDRGILRVLQEVVNQRDEVVLDFKAIIFVKRRTEEIEV
ncbi:MAG: MaoC family dehydratase [Alphaproteobacteria bacterium]